MSHLPPNPTRTRALLEDSIVSFRMYRTTYLIGALFNFAVVMLIYPRDATASMIAALLLAACLAAAVWSHRHLRNTRRLFSSLYPSLPLP